MENMTMEVVSAMAAEKPYKTYKKTILGKVAVKVFNPLTQKPEEVIIQGNPAKNESSCYIDVWSEQENVPRDTFAPSYRGSPPTTFFPPSGIRTFRQVSELYPFL